MHRFTSTLCTLTLALALAAPCAAEGTGPMKGHVLLSGCKLVIQVIDRSLTTSLTTRELIDSGMCLGLMHGLDTMNGMYSRLLKKTYDEDKTLYCAPDGSDSFQYARIVVKYLTEHPERLHEPGSVLALFALREAYPCPSPSQPVR